MRNTAHLRSNITNGQIPIRFEEDIFQFYDIGEFLRQNGHVYNNDPDLYTILYNLFERCFPVAFRNLLNTIEQITYRNVVNSTPTHNRRASDSFREKYIKYKNKYLKLKKMLENNN